MIPFAIAGFIAGLLLSHFFEISNIVFFSFVGLGVLALGFVFMPQVIAMQYLFAAVFGIFISAVGMVLFSPSQG